jgi:hypothetical protein
VRTAESPRLALLRFLQSAYEAGARTAGLADGGLCLLLGPAGGEDPGYLGGLDETSAVPPEARRSP